MDRIEQAMSRLNAPGAVARGGADVGSKGGRSTAQRRQAVPPVKQFSATVPATVSSGKSEVREKNDGPTLKLRLRSIGADSYRRPKKEPGPTVAAMRRVKRPLLANIYGQGVDAVANGRRIMVTSAIPGEGKTFTSIHLALSIAAEADCSVILVDADIVKPSVFSSLGVKVRPGLVDWFEQDGISATELVSDTDFDSLSMVSAGSKSVRACEYLASRSISNFFDEITESFPDHIVVVDSPPLLVASETKSLASHMGQILFVVGSGISSEQQVNDAIDLLDPDQSLSLVLNASTQASAFKNYGY